jgi:hypothetical protein
MAIEAELAAMAEIYDYDAARVQPLDHPAFTYPAIEEIAAAQDDALRRPDGPPVIGTVPPRLESQAQDRIEVGDATTVNGRTTRRTERGLIEVDVTSVQGKRSTGILVHLSTSSAELIPVGGALKIVEPWKLSKHTWKVLPMILLSGFSTGVKNWLRNAAKSPRTPFWSVASTNVSSSSVDVCTNSTQLPAWRSVAATGTLDNDGRPCACAQRCGTRRKAA